MSIGFFVDKNHKPSPAEVRSALGSKFGIWKSLNQFVLEGYHVKSEPKFYGRNYGWAYRYRKSGKALISVYPAQD